MYFVVCVKMVPDTTQVKIDPVTNTLIREGVPFITNPFDTHAVEEALRLKEKYGGRITALSMGPPSAEVILRKALALGVDDAVLLSKLCNGGSQDGTGCQRIGTAKRPVTEQHRINAAIETREVAQCQGGFPGC